MKTSSAASVAAAAVVLFCATVPSALAQNAEALPDVLDRLHAYLSDYAERLPATIASEHYIQRAGSTNSVVLDSDFGIVRLPGLDAWLGFRDVLRRNGKPVGDREARLDKLFLNP